MMGISETNFIDEGNVQLNLPKTPSNSSKRNKFNEAISAGSTVITCINSSRTTESTKLNDPQRKKKKRKIRHKKRHDPGTSQRRTYAVPSPDRWRRRPAGPRHTHTDPVAMPLSRRPQRRGAICRRRRVPTHSPSAPYAGRQWKSPVAAAVAAAAAAAIRTPVHSPASRARFGRRASRPHLAVYALCNLSGASVERDFCDIFSDSIFGWSVSFFSFSFFGFFGLPVVLGGLFFFFFSWGSTHDVEMVRWCVACFYHDEGEWAPKVWKSLLVTQSMFCRRR